MASQHEMRRTVAFTRDFEVILEPEDKGGYHVYCPRMRGCHSYGSTVDQALHNIAEAMGEYLDLLFDDVTENGGVILLPDENILPDGRVPEKLLAGIIADSGMSEEEFLERLAEMTQEDAEDEDDDGSTKAKGHRG